MAIDKDMLIGDLIQVDDSIAPILMRAGMHCLGCRLLRASPWRRPAWLHGIDCDTLVSQINEILSSKA